MKKQTKLSFDLEKQTISYETLFSKSSIDESKDEVPKFQKIFAITKVSKNDGLSAPNKILTNLSIEPNNDKNKQYYEKNLDNNP